MSKAIVARALTAHVARRLLFSATIAVCIIFALVVALCTLLAYLFTPWWLILLIPSAFLLGLFLIVRLIVAIVISRIHTTTLTATQRHAMDDFVDKIQQLLEARATPLPVFALITMKDIVVHRDITTVKKLISDTSGLRTDLDSLERLF